MRVSFILVICFAFLFGILAGCTGTSSVSDPIIGTWKSDWGGDLGSNMIFFENGKVIDSGMGGTWEKKDDTHYAVAITNTALPGYEHTSNAVFIYNPKSDTLNLGSIVFRRVRSQTTAQITPTYPLSYTPSLSTTKNVATSNKLSTGAWIWSRDNWGDWQHTVSWSGREAGPNSEYGPVMIGDHGEYGTDTQIYGGSTQSSVWRTFNDPSGVGWNTIEFTGLLSGTDTPSKRWMTIDVNNQQVFKGSATQNPPGNGVTFVIKRSFSQSPSIKVKISNGQDSAFGGRFAMSYYSVKLSREN